ncbi:iron complex transport system permease protein [Jatrophihabitans endophyticus]|uniref:Iron complex transport system permease protein n=1 Tax=Jatrophihabitans endophyticus TaxID=1206085 RepID=A0A1M5EI42_9ACTN|nr:iron complex transport system permease protein [Jatrophihabitans endophyticus]
MTRPLRLTGLYGIALVLILVLSAVHLTQGTSGVGAGDLLKLVVGGGGDEPAAVLVGSRVPRLVAALFVGLALGLSGALLQSIARNSLASPDTLAVNSGAYLAVVGAAVLGLSLPVLPAASVAFLGGLAAAAVVLGLSSGGGGSPTRLVLAGSAIALALDSLAFLLLILFEQQTVGLYAFSEGTFVQADTESVQQMAPFVLLAGLGALALSSRLDLLALGDDTAASLGLGVRRTRTVAVVLSVLLCAAAVAVAGPVAFVGFAAPVLARVLARAVGASARHLAIIPLSGLVGMIVVLAADVSLRAALGAQSGVTIPAGVVTTVFGAIVLVQVARTYRDAVPVRQRGRGGPPHPPGRVRFLLVTGVLAAAVIASGLVGMLVGDTTVLLGDVANWVRGATGPGLTFVLDTRVPRVLCALLAGAALAVAGTGVQAVCRNPLAEPGLLGITGGAGIGAVWLLVVRPDANIWLLVLVGSIGALLSFAAVLALSWRGGLASDRLVLIGFAFSSGAAAVITFIIVLKAPYQTNLALTWLAGTTYGRTFGSAVPVAIALVVVVAVLVWRRRELDLLAVDDDLPRTLGVGLERTRLLVLTACALLSAAAVSAIGVVGFVGLVAPHMARALVGSRNARVVPVALLIGALLVSVADAVGRTVIAPSQIPVGITTALIGVPYFVYLLWRSRA